MVEKQIKDRAAAGNISYDQAKHDLLAEKMPSGEAATPEQMAGAAVFLCSPAADQIRGIALADRWRLDRPVKPRRSPYF
jgi:3-hydroxybutyrate dehydrogenase